MVKFPNTYSGVVAWLKVILPLIALGLLSTLFLFSRARTPPTSLSFLDLALQERIKEQQITSPYFVGTTENGLSLTLSADSARPDSGDLTRLSADNVTLQIKSKEQTLVVMSSQSGVLDTGSHQAELTGGVSMQSLSGYKIETDSLSSALNSLRVETGGEVRGAGPVGSFRAGKMILTSGREDKTLHLLFTNGVILTNRQKK